jgi:phosphoribosyl 1,2-cyclic phosphodiesterase
MQCSESVTVQPSPQAPFSSPSQALIVKFWGVRGNVPTPGQSTMRYGGNTACVEVQVAGQRIILDGGTGLRVLGKQLLAEMPIQAHLLFTHTHWDRIQGFPFFAPAFVADNHFDIYGAFGLNGASIKQRLSDQMLRPNFPAPLQDMRSYLRFHDIAPGSVINLDGVNIETLALNSTSGALAYRMGWGDRSVVYAVDDQPGGNPNLQRFAQNADLLIYDMDGYDPASDPSSDSVTESSSLDLEAAIATQAKQIILCHHDPDHEDSFLDAFEARLQQTQRSVMLAYEGMTLAIAQ